jgi:inosine-uridine nucleoside N-ribohydrolase
MLNKISDPKNAEFCIYQDAKSLDIFFDYGAVIAIGGLDIDSKVIRRSFEDHRDRTEVEEVVSSSGLLAILILYKPSAVVEILDSHFCSMADYWRNFPR